MSEITPADDRETAADDLQRLKSLPPINIYRLLAIVPGALPPWADLVDAIYGCELDPRLREIAICRQAQTAGAEYELHQHRLIAQNNGVTDAEISALVTEPTVTSLDDTANLVCRAADELETSATVSDELLTNLLSALGRREATELILILSFYCAVGRFTNATRAAIETDDPLAHAANPNVQ
jgi:alkylhydroperoxidase family enzyme